MAARTGTQIKADLASIETAVDTCISAPTRANWQTLVTLCDTVIQNARDSKTTVVEQPAAGQPNATGGRRSSHDFRRLVDGVRKDALTLERKGEITEADSWRKLKRTQFGPPSAWRQQVARPTTT